MANISANRPQDYSGSPLSSYGIHYPQHHHPSPKTAMNCDINWLWEKQIESSFLLFCFQCVVSCVCVLWLTVCCVCVMFVFTAGPCLPGFLQCKNGRCFSPKHLCDFRDNCGDGTDEKDCGTSCTFESGRCGWKSSLADNFDWTLGGGFDKSVHPPFDHTLNNERGNNRVS